MRVVSPSRLPNRAGCNPIRAACGGARSRARLTWRCGLDYVEETARTHDDHTPVAAQPLEFAIAGHQVIRPGADGRGQDQVVLGMISHPADLVANGCASRVPLQELVEPLQVRGSDVVLPPYPVPIEGGHDLGYDHRLVARVNACDRTASRMRFGMPRGSRIADTMVLVSSTATIMNRVKMPCALALPFSAQRPLRQCPAPPPPESCRGSWPGSHRSPESVPPARGPAGSS